MPIVSNELRPAKVSDHPQEPCHDPETVILDWEGDDDPENPFNWTQRKKWLVTGLGLFATFISLVNGSIITVAHEAINEQFNVSDAEFPHSYWPVTSWGVGGAAFSLLLLPIMEDFGVKYVFLITYAVFICFLVPMGAATNFATIIITRFFTGGCVAILGNTVAGIISNIFEGSRARTVPMSLYIAVYLIASSMGPVIGASIFQFLPWRWIGYIELIWTGVFFPLFIVALPESRGKAILQIRAKRLRREGKKTYTKEELDTTPLFRVVLRSMKRPLFMLCTEPVVFIATLWSAFSLGTIYLFNQSVEQVFGGIYGWGPVQAGYIQAAIIVGDVLGWTMTLYTNQWYYASAKRNTEIPNTPIPEARLYGALMGGYVGVSGGMFVYAWTSYPSIHWIVPAVGLAMVGFGTTAVVIGIVTYLVDAYSIYAGSAVGAVGLGENAFIAFLPIATQSMYSTLGFHWASSLLGFVSLVLAAAPIPMFIWGKQIRDRSSFMKESMASRRQDSATIRA